VSPASGEGRKNILNFQSQVGRIWALCACDHVS